MSFVSAMEEAVAAARRVDGWLSGMEMRFLFSAAANPTTRGEVVEIGSYKGKSTLLLAKGASWAGQSRVIACDPFLETWHTESDRADKGERVFEEFLCTLSRNGLMQCVEFHREKSSEMARGWTRPIRLLWIDGDHSLQGVTEDLHDYLPYLAGGAIVALHDVDHRKFEGPMRCFIDDVVLSDSFGVCGMCRSIGWAQWVGGGGRSRHRDVKAKIYKALARRRAEITLQIPLRGMSRRRYQRLCRNWDLGKWLRSVGAGNDGALRT